MLLFEKVPLTACAYPLNASLVDIKAFYDGLGESITQINPIVTHLTIKGIHTWTWTKSSPLDPNRMERHIKLHEEVPRKGDMALKDNLTSMQKLFLKYSAFNGTSNDLSAMQKSFLRDYAFNETSNGAGIGNGT